jgi:hypothetical protein
MADTGGLVVTDDGRRVLVIDRRTGALAVLAFALGVIALVVGGFGCVAFISDALPVTIGAVFLAVGLVFAAATFAVVRLGELEPNWSLGLFSYRGGAVVSLDQVHFARARQRRRDAARGGAARLTRPIRDLAHTGNETPTV